MASREPCLCWRLHRLKLLTMCWRKEQCAVVHTAAGRARAASRGPVLVLSFDFLGDCFFPVHAGKAGWREVVEFFGAELRRREGVAEADFAVSWPLSGGRRAATGEGALVVVLAERPRSCALGVVLVQ